MKSAQRIYNTSPLAKSEAKYIGRQVPTESLKFPGIIHHPLKSLYSKEHLKDAFPVNIFIYSSGILIEEREKLSWFPIQNFYCSAAVVPQQDKHGLSFRDLGSFQKPKKHNRIIFAMVVRQPHDDKGRRVLMCHAFLVTSDTTARRLIDATQLAYQNKDGWNHPMNDRQFLNAKIDFTMNKIRSNDEDGIEDLKDITLARDSRLAQMPRPQQTTPAKLPNRSEVTPSATPRPSIQHQNGWSPHQVVVRGSITSTRRKTYPIPNASREIVPQGNQSSVQMSGKIPVTQAAAYYQGFTSDILTNGQAKPVRGWSVNGHQVNGSFSMQSSSIPVNGFADYNYNGMKLGHKSRRQMSAPATPKSHRVLASSEPMELMNGQRRPSNVSVMDWDLMLDPSPPSNHEHRRAKHNISKIPSDSAQLNGGIVNGNHNGNQVQSSTSQSMVSESGYSITKVRPESTNGVMGDDELDTSFADQKL